MNEDAIPEILYPNPKKPERYVVVMNDQIEKQSFADALARAELGANVLLGVGFGIYRLDSTVELINGVISVRSET